MNRTAFLLSVLSLSFMPPLISLVYAHEAHEHGVAKINIAVDGAQVDIGMESPLANLLPFEHSPATLEQRKQVREMARRMRQADTLFQLSPRAECRLEKVALASEKFDAALLDPNAPLEPAQAGDNSKEPSGTGQKTGEAEHGDLDADFSFTCAKPEHLNSVDIGLFAVWPNLQKINVQAVTPQGQHAAGLTPQEHVVSW